MRKALIALGVAVGALLAPLGLWLLLGSLDAPATEAQSPAPTTWAYEVLPGIPSNSTIDGLIAIARSLFEPPNPP